MQTDALAAAILHRAAGVRRLMVAVAGPPGGGKSTLAEALETDLNQRHPGTAAVMPMDGFHLDNAVIGPRGLMPRKGSPETFDVGGFAHTLARIRAADQPVAVPVFDRALDLARAGARIVGPDVPVILVEGNYLLLDRDPWRELAALFDLTVFLAVSEAVLEQRLTDRWLQFGHSAEAARDRALSNDIPNARLVLQASRAADIVLTQDS